MNSTLVKIILFDFIIVRREIAINHVKHIRMRKICQIEIKRKSGK